MTALNEYDRLEATGLWRQSPEDQRREVIVSLGDASLTISDLQERILTHWSLAALTRASRGTDTVVYHPDGDPGETLELAPSEEQMIDAIARLQSAIERGRPHPGRLRLWMTLGMAGLVLLAMVFWLPGALVRHTLRVVPDVKRVELSEQLLTELQRVSGSQCQKPVAMPALAKLSTRLTGTRDGIVVLPGGIVATAHLPDGTVILNRTLIEDWEEPEVPAGFVIAETARLAETDPLGELLDHAGLPASLRFLTTGEMSAGTLRDYAEWLVTTPAVALPTPALLDSFEAAQVSTRPYAYAVDVTGESTLDLIEADPMPAGVAQPVLPDSDWIRLQEICGG